MSHILCFSFTIGVAVAFSWCEMSSWVSSCCWTGCCHLYPPLVREFLQGGLFTLIGTLAGAQGPAQGFVSDPLQASGASLCTHQEIKELIQVKSDPVGCFLFSSQHCVLGTFRFPLRVCSCTVDNRQGMLLNGWVLCLNSFI